MPGATARDEPTEGTRPGEPTLRTILMLELADRAAMIERKGAPRAADLIRRHERLVRDLIRRHRGREVDKSSGFLLLFERPLQAVAFALEHQRRLQELSQLEHTPMAARIGIHVGEAVLWESSADEIARGARPVEIEGLAMPVAAHLMELALPGQTLLSSIVRELAEHAEAELRDAGRAPIWKAHGRYRFESLAKPRQVHEIGEFDVAHFRTPPGGAGAQRIRPIWRRPAIIAAAVALAVAALAVLAWSGLRPQPGIDFAERDWVVVGDFENRTGEVLLDGSLDLAFRQGLTQSRHVNVLSELQVRDALERMQLDPAVTRIDRRIGAELARHEAARALLLPSVTDSGGSLRVAVDVVDPHSRSTVWVSRATARRPEDLLPAIDAVVEELRTKLGESLQALADYSMPLARATTANLEALQIYSVARKQYQDGHHDDARRLFERALELDPEFAMAHAGIAATLLPQGRFAEGLVPARRAAQLRGRLSAREAAYVDALLAWAEDPGRSADRWRDFAALYPDAGSGQNNAAMNYWFDLNRCAEAVPLFDEAFRSRDPSRHSAGHGKGYCQLWMGQALAAEQSFKEALQVRPLPATQGLADVYTYLERFDEADAQLSADPTGVPARLALEAKARRVTWFAYQGRLREAQDAARQLAVAAEASDAPAAASRARLYLAALRQAAGEPQDLAELAKRERPLLSGQESPQYPASLHLGQLALLAVRGGQPELARAWLADIDAVAGERANPALDSLLEVVAARLVADPVAGLARLAPGKDAHEYFQVRVAAADLARAGADADAELLHLRWIDQQRSRAFAEYGGQFAGQVTHVLDVNRALLRQIEVEPDAALREILRERLRARWKHADIEVLAQLLALAGPLH
jgi:putative peptide modification system cyclase